jgi:OOP family OmpA-OmpF porin
MKGDPDMIDRNLSRFAAAIASALVLAALLVPILAVAQATGIESEIAAVETRLLDSQAADLALIAPKAFGEAKDKLVEARQTFAKGGKIEDIRAKLREATLKLDEAAKVESVGRLLLKNSLIARADALEANAPKFAVKEWESANSSMYDAGREVEKGNQNKARDKAAEAEQLYRAAELEAIRADLLGAAHTARDEALAAGADKKATLTFSEGENLLGSAEKTLLGDRYQRAEAKDQARQATIAFRHAAYLAGLVDKVGEKNKGQVEQVVLSYEDALAKVAQELNIEPDFSQGVGPVDESVLSALSSLKTDRENMQADIRDRDSRLKRAAARIDSLDATLAVLQQRERTSVATIEREQQRQATLKDARNMFTKDEATVLLDGEYLIIRLYGLSFPVGSSEIQPRNFELLTKLQQVLRSYPAAPVTIEGNTDAQGDADFNQALSLRRAEAVRSYLIANMGGDANRFQAVGFGESKPIANNETADGRALNRRIDVRIDISGQ